MVSIPHVREKWQLMDIGRADEPSGSLGRGEYRMGVVRGEGTGLFWDLSNKDLTTHNWLHKIA